MLKSPSLPYCYTKTRRIHQILQSWFTLDRYVQNQIHFPIIRTRLTKETLELVTDIYGRWSKPVIDILLSKMVYFYQGISIFWEADNSLAEWTSVAALESMMTIVARSASRVFVGTTLCESHTLQCFGGSDWLCRWLGRNPEWIRLCIEYTIKVVKTALFLHLFSTFLRPWVSALTPLPFASI